MHPCTRHPFSARISRYLVDMQNHSPSAAVDSGGSSSLTEEEVYEVWLCCHQTMCGIHDRDEAEAVGDPDKRGLHHPPYFSAAQKALAEYIFIRESMRAVGRC